MRKMALIDYNICQPAHCEGGICLAVQACKKKVLKQEAVNEVPMPDPFLCSGCGDCARACPYKAVRVVIG
jgi:translation initiation factor RLI1